MPLAGSARAQANVQVGEDGKPGTAGRKLNVKVTMRDTVPVDWNGADGVAAYLRCWA